MLIRVVLLLPFLTLGIDKILFLFALGIDKFGLDKLFYLH